MRIPRSAARLAAAACLIVLTAGCGDWQRGTGNQHQPHTYRHRHASTVGACQYAGHDGAGPAARCRCRAVTPAS